MNKFGRVWTQEEYWRVRDLIDCGWTPERISGAVNRNMYAIYHRLYDGPPRPLHRQEAWSLEDRCRVRDLRDCGWDWERIAEVVDRDVSSVRQNIIPAKRQLKCSPRRYMAALNAECEKYGVQRGRAMAVKNVTDAVFIRSTVYRDLWRAGYSLPEIARAAADASNGALSVDHTTVLHCIRHYDRIKDRFTRMQAAAVAQKEHREAAARDLERRKARRITAQIANGCQMD